MEEKYYNVDIIKRFLEGVEKNRRKKQPAIINSKLNPSENPHPDCNINLLEGVSDEDFLRVCGYLSDLVYSGADLRKELKITVNNKMTAVDKRETIHSVENTIVMAAMNGELSREEAIEELMQVTGNGDSSARKYYDRQKKSVASTFKFIKQVRKMAGWDDIKLCPEEPEKTPLKQAEIIVTTLKSHPEKRIKEIQRLLDMSRQEAQRFIASIANT